MTWLIVGLGNPGSQYAMTRHNVGFIALDVLNESLSKERWSDQHKAHVIKMKWQNETVILAKPQTFMNLSGQSVVSLMNFYKIEKENLLVLHDDLDIAFTEIKLQKNRGHAGHNGIRNISELLGTADYARLKLGIGRPENKNIPVADYVLQKFTSDEVAKLPDFLSKAGDCVEKIVHEGYQKGLDFLSK